MKFTMSERVPLLRPLRTTTSGDSQEALHSLVRRTAEKNHLSPAVVISQIFSDASKGGQTPVRLGNNMMHLISKGERISNRWIAALSASVDMSKLLDQTLCSIANIQGVGEIQCSHWRKWCSRCYEEDVSTDIGPYDRLIWSIEFVGVCIRHKNLLRNSCPSCGKSKLPVISGNDISGFCPCCQAWLGGKDVSLPTGDDDFGRYLCWTTQCFVDLLDCDDLPQDATENILEMIMLLRELHCAGVDKNFATAISRNKSVVCTWLKKKARPSWQALCDISFVFHVPLLDLLRSDKNAVAFSFVRNLPLQTRKIERKKAKKTDLEYVKLIYSQVLKDLIPGVTTITSVGRRLGIPSKELRRILPDQTEELAVFLRERQFKAREKSKSIRSMTLAVEVESAIRIMIQEGVKLTRRAVERKLRLGGISIQRHETQYVRRMVKHLAGTFDEGKEIIGRSTFAVVT